MEDGGLLERHVFAGVTGWCLKLRRVDYIRFWVGA